MYILDIGKLYKFSKHVYFSYLVYIIIVILRILILTSNSGFYFSITKWS